MVKCPYCDNEMVLGYLHSSGALVWDKEILRDVIIPSSEGLILTKKTAWSKALNIKAHYCENCRLLLSKLDE